MKVVAFDTETKGLDWFNPDQRAFLASWADEAGEYVADLSIPEEVSDFLAAVQSADVLVCHNLAFDVHQVRETLGWDALLSGAELHDTALMSRVMFPSGAGAAPAHGLKHLADVHIDPQASEAESHMFDLAADIGVKMKETGGYYDLWRAYPEAMEKYAALDARFTWDLFTKFSAEMTDAQHKTYALEQTVAPVLIRAEQIGVALDKDCVLRLRDTYEQLAADVYTGLVETLGAEALGGKGSEAALIEALQKQGIPLHRTTDSGQLATNKFALQEFEADFPVIGQLQQYRQATKFLSTYIGPMVDRDVVHTRYMQCGAWTSRMSSMSPNMQNIPNTAGKEVREMFVPRPGYAFVVCDYDSIEVRLLAWYLGDAGFRKLIDDGHDPHSWMAANIHGGEPEFYAKGGPHDGERSSAKNTLFAITYGAGAPRISDMNKISKDAAKALISKIKSSLPNYYKLNKRIRAKIEDEGFVSTLWGRKQLVSKDKSYVGLNALIQGSAADIMKQGLVNVADAVAPLGGIPLLVVHDEVVVEVPVEHADACLEVTKAALIDAYDLSPALGVTGSWTTANYAEAK